MSHKLNGFTFYDCAETDEARVERAIALPPMVEQFRFELEQAAAALFGMFSLQEAGSLCKVLETLPVASPGADVLLSASSRRGEVFI